MNAAQLMAIGSGRLLGLLMIALMAGRGVASANHATVPETKGNPIYVTFVIHFDPLKADGRNWETRGREVVCTEPTKDIYLLWADQGEQTIDFSQVLISSARRVEGRSGKESVVDAKSLTVCEEPIVVEAAEGKP